MKRPTRRVLIVGLMGLLLFGAASTAQAGWLFVLSAGVLGVAAASIAIPHRLRDLEVTRTVPRRTIVGEEVTTRVTLTARRRSIPMVRVEDRFGAFDPVAVASERLGPGGSAEVRLIRTATTRGVFDHGEMRVRTGAPFGLLQSSRTLTAASELIVVPRWVELRSFPFLESESAAPEGAHERARTGTGTEYLGVREYRPGDPRRSIHWRSTARVGRLVVREFEEEVATPIVLAVGGWASPAGAGAFEAVVSAAASITRRALASGHPVGIAGVVKGEIVACTNPGFERALTFLAGVESTRLPMGEIARAALGSVPRRGTLVLLSTTEGASGNLYETIGGAERSGWNAVGVIARSSTWDEAAADDSGPRSIVDDRRRIRVIERERDLAACLAG